MTALPRPIKEPAWGVHPWLPNTSSEHMAAELTAPARVCWLAREVHTEFVRLGRRRADIEPGSPLDLDGKLIDDGWTHETLIGALDCFSAMAVNHLAGVSALAWAGEQLITVPVLVRASVEASATAMWVLEPGEVDLDATAEEQMRQWGSNAKARGARAHLLTYNDIARSVFGVPKGEMRTARKHRRKHYLDKLRALYGEEAVAMHSGGTLLDSLDGESTPTFDELFKAVNNRLDHDGEWTLYYEVLSRLSHPSPVVINDYYSSPNSNVYDHDPKATRRLMWVAVMAFTQLLKHTVGYAFADDAEGDAFLREWEDKVAIGWPSFFGDP